MNSLRNLVVRDTTPTVPLTPTVLSLLIALICLLVVGFIAVIALLALRSVRRKRVSQSVLPIHNGSKKPQHRRLTITATPYGRHSPSISISEKQSFLSYASSPPTSPVPEIHITFPDEDDKTGKRQSGRVVVVRISETGGVGLEPYESETLPAYQQREGETWKSLDLERIGGLREKEHGEQWS